MIVWEWDDGSLTPHQACVLSFVAEVITIKVPTLRGEGSQCCSYPKIYNCTSQHRPFVEIEGFPCDFEGQNGTVNYRKSEEKAKNFILNPCKASDGTVTTSK